MIKEKVVNDAEVETRLAGKNLTSIGGIRLFDKFILKIELCRLQHRLYDDLVTKKFEPFDQPLLQYLLIQLV